MQKRFAMKLADALESGKYEQTSSALGKFDNNGNCFFCCLGVACNIAGIKKRKTYDNPLIKDAGGNFIFGNSSEAYLPPKVVNDFGFYNQQGGRRDGKDIIIDGLSYEHLANANDQGVTFKEIADYIRINYKDL